MAHAPTFAQAYLRISVACVLEGAGEEVVSLGMKMASVVPHPAAPMGYLCAGLSV